MTLNKSQITIIHNELWTKITNGIPMPIEDIVTSNFLFLMLLFAKKMLKYHIMNYIVVILLQI